ncbi:uncharacterized protein G2W53_037145 [Senna tora]|uniref:Uncharacterized protein n=1 Tax=Senna tora TaxID=362788 RepID=A0A834SVD0_9FABA|nr:uncharacterized protein G2W53_037145 [Senna tora]
MSTVCNDVPRLTWLAQKQVDGIGAGKAKENVGKGYNQNMIGPQRVVIRTWVPKQVSSTIHKPNETEDAIPREGSGWGNAIFAKGKETVTKGMDLGGNHQTQTRAVDPSTSGEKDIIRPLETDRESLAAGVSNDDEETLDGESLAYHLEEEGLLTEQLTRDFLDEEAEQKDIEFGFNSIASLFGVANADGEDALRQDNGTDHSNVNLLTNYV